MGWAVEGLEGWTKVWSCERHANELPWAWAAREPPSPAHLAANLRLSVMLSSRSISTLEQWGASARPPIRRDAALPRGCGRFGTRAGECLGDGEPRPADHLPPLEWRSPPLAPF